MAELQDKLHGFDKSQTTPEESLDDTYNRVRLRRPIPGQSLTQDPDKPLPFERPPEFTNIDKAQKYMFEKLMSTSTEIVEMLSAGMPVETIVQLAVTIGFQQGKWTPDLMLLLIEPTFYIVLFIAEVGHVDYILTDSEEDYLDADTVISVEGTLRKQLGRIGQHVQQEVAETGVTEAASSVLPPSLLARVQDSAASGGTNG